MIYRLKLDFLLEMREGRYTLLLKRVQQGTCLEHLEENYTQLQKDYHSPSQSLIVTR